jgi:hypothetical protein
MSTKEKPSTAIERRPLDVVPALLTPAELAARLAVPQSWVRKKCRRRALERDADPLPHKKLGKYTRFSWPEVEAWLLRQGT